MKSKSYKTGKVFYLISLILYLVLTTFLIYFFINSISKDNNNNLNIAMYLIFGVIIIGIPGNSIITILDLVSVILLSINFKKQVNKEKKDKIALISSIILLFLPLITEITLFIICNSLTK